MKQIVLDTETTGLDVKEGHRIIEIAAVVLQNRHITQEVFHVYLNPERAVDPGAYAIHKISDEFLKDKPLFSEIAASFLEFLTDADELIIHNAAFDLSFLNYEFGRLGFKHKPLEEFYKVVDSLALARKQRPNQRNTLDALCKVYLQDYDKDRDRQYHNALLDTQLLAQVYLELTRRQTSLFERIAIRDTQEKRKEDAIRPPIPLNLIVQYADEIELRAHEEHLKKIAQMVGQCLWED